MITSASKMYRVLLFFLPISIVALTLFSSLIPVALGADEGEGPTGLAPITEAECGRFGIGCPDGVEEADATTVVDFGRMVINVLLALVALLALIVLIIAGVMYIASIGDQEKTKQAKYVILYTVIGLIVIGLAAVVVNFIVNIFA